MSTINTWEFALVQRAIKEAREFAKIADNPLLVNALHRYADALQESLEQAMS